jgi:hypothetical protein
MLLKYLRFEAFRYGIVYVYADFSQFSKPLKRYTGKITHKNVANSPKAVFDIRFINSFSQKVISCFLRESYKSHNPMVFVEIYEYSVTLEMIYDEVLRVNERLRLIEDVIEEVVIKGLTEVSLSKGKIKEIECSIQEMKTGKRVTLEELKSPPK